MPRSSATTTTTAVHKNNNNNNSNDHHHHHHHHLFSIRHLQQALVVLGCVILVVDVYGFVWFYRLARRDPVAVFGKHRQYYVHYQQQQQQQQQQPPPPGQPGGGGGNAKSHRAVLGSRDVDIDVGVVDVSADVDDNNQINDKNVNHDDDDDDKSKVLAKLRQAGVVVVGGGENQTTTSQRSLLLAQQQRQLPTWRQITNLYGHQPVILGSSSLENVCATFQQQVPAVRRMLGAAGMFSTGTNLVTQLLKKNCIIPERAAAAANNNNNNNNNTAHHKATKEELGMRWQVPWGKHTPASYKYKHATQHAQNINKDDILPVVTVRNPWRWMQSMCKNPYTAKWPHHHICPHLLLQSNDNDNEKQWNQVTVKYGAGTETYQSLVHLWLDWYKQYMVDADYPLLIVRLEDLVFYTQETISQICECAGGVVADSEHFEYVVESAKKDSPGHDTSTGLITAWIKYSQPLEPQAGFVLEDYQAALQALNHDPYNLMKKLGYAHPPASEAEK